MNMTDLAATLLPIAAIQIVGWGTPGPNHLTIISASVSGGRASGLRAGLGIAAGALTWSLIAISGIAVMFEVFPTIYAGLRLLGAGYLIFLGLKAFKAATSGGVFNLENAKSMPASNAPFKTAYLVMMTNPKAVLFFGSILTAFIPPEAPFWLMGIIVAQIGILGLCLNTIAALFFSAPLVMKAFQSVSVLMSVIFGLLFCALGAVVAADVLQLFA